MHKSTYHINALDGLRGLAALIVVFSHTSNSQMYFFPGMDLSGIGKTGVFLFFLLSSFLLTLPLLSQGQRVFDRKNLLHFIQRRFFRIYPLFSLYLLAGVLSTIVFSQYLGLENIGVPFALDWQGLISHLLLQNGLGVTWSIVVEVKFYFILPILAFIVNLALQKGVTFTAVLIITLICSAHFFSPASESLKNDMSIAPYMPVFLLGMLLAVIQYAINNQLIKLPYQPKLFNYLSWFAFAGLIFMTPSVYSIIVTPVDRYFFHHEFIIYSILWSCILFTVINIPGWLQHFFQFKILRFFGFISFSLYLFHSSIIGALKFLNLRSDLDAWVVLAISSIASYMSYIFFEKPTSKIKLLK
jgi:peptidoglycan/LPS O-acetylase OafA/YrhL